MYRCIHTKDRPNTPNKEPELVETFSVPETLLILTIDNW